MISVHSGMTNKVLTAVLADEFGIEAPSKTNKETMLKLLEDAGAVVTPEPDADEPTGKEGAIKLYVINIFKEKNQKGMVCGCVNGKAFALPRGIEIEVSESIYLNLTQSAIRTEYEPIEGGGVESFKVPSYPLSLVRVIEK